MYTVYPNKRKKMFSRILDDAIPERSYNGLKLWFHDPFEMLHDKSVNLQARNKCYFKILITPKVSKIDTSIMDFDLHQ